MLRVLRDYLYSFVGLTASFATLVLFGRDVFPRTSDTSKVAVIFIGLLTIYYFSESIFLKVKWGRSKGYGQAIGLVNNGIAEVNDLGRNPCTVNEVAQAFRSLCDQLAKALTLVTSTNCSVSIKVLTLDTDELGSIRMKVVTFCRDSNSAKTRHSGTIKTKHWLEENTDFLTIMKNLDTPHGRYFFSNQLPFLFNYQNTSFNIYGEPHSEGIFLIKDFVRYWRWPLPYKSAIVVPICPANRRDLKNLVGFLCVDSPNLLAFNKKYDIDMLIGISDIIYDIMRDISLQEQYFLGV